MMERHVRAASSWMVVEPPRHCNCLAKRGVVCSRRVKPRARPRVVMDAMMAIETAVWTRRMEDFMVGVYVPANEYVSSDGFHNIDWHVMKWTET